jgi:hypothetical protein
MNDSVKKVVDAFATKNGYLVLKGGSEIIIQHISEADTENMKLLFHVKTGKVEIKSENWSLCALFYNIEDAILYYINEVASIGDYNVFLLKCVLREAKKWNIDLSNFEKMFRTITCYQIDAMSREINWHKSQLKSKQEELGELMSLMEVNGG